MRLLIRRWWYVSLPTRELGVHTLRLVASFLFFIAPAPPLRTIRSSYSTPIGVASPIGATKHIGDSDLVLYLKLMLQRPSQIGLQGCKVGEDMSCVFTVAELRVLAQRMIYTSSCPAELVFLRCLRGDVAP